VGVRAEVGPVGVMPTPVASEVVSKRTCGGVGGRLEWGVLSLDRFYIVFCANTY
jgi:hypothetical protein